MYANERKNNSQSARFQIHFWNVTFVFKSSPKEQIGHSVWVRKMGITWQMELYTRQISIITLGRSAQLSETADARLVSTDHSLLLPPPPPPSRKNLVDSSGRHRHLSILDFEHLEPKVNKIWLVKLFLSYRILIFERSHFNSLINWFSFFSSGKKLSIKLEIKLDSVASSQFLSIPFFFSSSFFMRFFK